MVGYEVSSTTRLFLSSSPFPSARSLFPTTVAARNQCHSLHRQALVQDVWGAIPRRILEEEGTAAPASCSGAPPTRCCVRRHARPRRVRLGKATRNRVDSRAAAGAPPAELAPPPPPRLSPSWLTSIKLVSATLCPAPTPVRVVAG
ncbi:hypothetical protein DAI22_01g364550 [Oryza sativa Japonica Group]|nr:hypothetical protein DAI22_01g364550 [Oryza sativa Japonica Group]